MQEITHTFLSSYILLIRLSHPRDFQTFMKKRDISVENDAHALESSNYNEFKLTFLLWFGIVTKRIEEYNVTSFAFVCAFYFPICQLLTAKRHTNYVSRVREHVTRDVICVRA